MFEKIHFFSYEGNYDSNKVRADRNYKKNMEQRNIEAVTDGDYHIDGKVHCLYPHLITGERQEKLICLKTFCHMISGKEYYSNWNALPSAFLLLYTYQGSGLLTYDGRSYPLEENDIILIDCRKPHVCQTQGEFWNHSDLYFFGGISEYFYQENFADRGVIFHCRQPEDYQNHLEKILLIHTGSSPMRDFAFSCEMENLLFKVLDYGENTQTSKRMPENIRLLTYYMERHFQNDFSLDEMAQFAGMSKYYLCRQFRQYTGFAPMEYMIHLRLLHAETLLQSTNLPCYKIGILAGFPSEANFIRHFKKKNGMTPGEYRG